MGGDGDCAGASVATRGSASRGTGVEVKIRQPSHEFTFSFGISFIPYPLVLTPVV
jgi:hypothetical protein